MSACHDRVLAALELRQPDRVPTMDVMEEYSNIYQVLGRKPVPLGFLFTNKFTARAIDHLAPLINRSRLMESEMHHFSHDRTEAAVRFGYDSAWVMHVPIWRFMDSRTAGDIYGRDYQVVMDGKGNLGTPVYRAGALKDPADWAAWDKRDILRLPSLANRVYSGIQKDFGDRIFVFGSFLFGLFENAWQPFGFDRFVVALRRDPEFLHRYIGFYADHYCMMLEAWADAGLPGACYSDDMAYRSGPMLNPRVMEEFFGEPLRRITETAHKLGMKIIVHTDGDIYPLLKWFADCGFDGIHSLEPTAGVELARVKEIIGDRLCLLGNVDITYTLTEASRDEVREAVRLAIHDAGSGGGFIIAPTNSHPDISLERLRWMLDATREFGVYPTAGLNESP